MEQFLVVTTTTEQNLADRACAALEEAGIPVMIEHIEIVDGKQRASGYRLLVPSQFTQTAMKVVNASSALPQVGFGNIH